MWVSRFLPVAVASLSFLLAVPVSATNPDDVLISQDGVVVTQEDFHRYVEERIPEQHRMAALDQPNAVRELIAQLFTIRALARDAEDVVDLEDPDLQWRIDFRRDRVLMDELIQRRVEESVASVDWEALAREHYRANIEEFETPERVRASHVLIKTEERSAEEAQALAEEVARKAREGADFAELAREYSEDASVSRNDGDLGRFQRGRMVPEFEEAVFAMDEPGAISDPVQTEFGFHVIRLQDRSEGGVRPFERVRDQIIENLKDEHAREVRLEEVERIRGADGIEVNQDAVSALEAQLRVDRSPDAGSRHGSDSTE